MDKDPIAVFGIVIVILVAGLIAQSTGLIPNFNEGGLNGDGITRIYNGTSFSQQMNNVDNDYIDRIVLVTNDTLGDNTNYTLERRLIGTTVGHEITGDWYAYYYAYYRMRGGGVGDTGDLHAFVKIWDARNMTQNFSGTPENPTLVQYEISRISWGKLTVYIDGVEFWVIPNAGTPENPDRPFRAYVDGGFWGNGTVT